MSTTGILYPAPGAAPMSAGQAAGAQQVASGTVTPNQVGAGGKLVAFEGLLKRAGHIIGLILKDIVKYAIPVASIVAIADPAAAPALEAFTASVRLVQATVISVQQKWAAQGSAANEQKLAEVLEIVEQPIVTMFAQVGLQVDTAYVTNLVNGIVAILNAQPGLVLPTGGA